MMQDDERILAAIAVIAPPAGFTDNVVARARGGRRRTRIVAIVAGLVVVGTVVGWRLGSRRDLAGGAHTDAIETLSLGRRGVAVAQPGTELEWIVRAGGATTVTQHRGSAFFRVEPGGPFEVITADGKVIVTGTCFATAIVPSGTLVTVYEGRVLLRSKAGELPLSAGESGFLRASVPPVQIAVADASRESLAREIATLRVKAKAMEDRLGALTAYGDDKRAGSATRFFDFTPEELQEMARDCEVRADLPPYGMTPGPTSHEIDKLGLTDAERATYDRIVAADDARFTGEMRALYGELVGDENSGKTLELQSLEREIDAKSTEADKIEVPRRLSQERAGLLPPRPDPRKGSIYERYVRLLMRAGDDLERDLARELGPTKARSLRQLNGGIMLGRGCEP